MNRAAIAVFVFSFAFADLVDAQVNDDCFDRLDVGVGTTLLNTLGATSSGVLSSCGPSPSVDRYFGFVPPVTGFVEVRVDGLGAPVPTVLDHAVYADPCSLSSELACSEGDNVSIVPVTAGSEVVIRVFGNSGPGSLSIDVFSSSPNDECSTAISVGEATTAITTALATPSSGGVTCGPAGQPDVFYEYTATGFSIVGVRILDSVHSADASLYTDCTLTDQVACVTSPQTAFRSVSPGDSVIIRISSPSPVTTTLLVEENPLPPLQTCETRQTFDGTLVGAFNWSLFGATDSGVDSSCGNALDNDTYYGMTYPVAGDLTLSLSIGTADVAAYIDTQPCDLQNQVGCEELNQPFSFPVSAGDEVVIRIFGNPDNGLLFTTFLPDPVNDSCATATSIFEGTMFVNLGSAAATQPSPTTVCGGEADPDVFYEFTSNCDGVLSVREIDSVSVSVFDDCTLSTERDCSAPGEDLQVVVVAGESVVVRVSAPGGGTGFFTLSCEESAFIRGDVDANGTVDVADVVGILETVFGVTSFAVCLDAANVDADETLAIDDAIRLVQFLFLGGAPPPVPFPRCGILTAGQSSLSCDGGVPTCP